MAYEAYDYDYTVPDKEARMWAMWCHISSLSVLLGFPFGNIIVPAIIWIMKGKEHPFIDFNGKEVLNFQISLTIYLFVSLLLCLILIGIIPLLIIAFGGPILTIIAAIKANDGQEYRYPFTIRLID